jgi:hypothetical protein
MRDKINNLGLYEFIIQTPVAVVTYMYHIPCDVVYFGFSLDWTSFAFPV